MKGTIAVLVSAWRALLGVRVLLLGGIEQLSLCLLLAVAPKAPHPYC